MYRYVIEELRHVPPFNQPASQLTIGLQPLKLHHEGIFNRTLAGNCTLRGVFDSRDHLGSVSGESIVYRDNLWFDDPFFEQFLRQARQKNTPGRAAFFADDPAYSAYVVPLAEDIEPDIDESGRAFYWLDLWYFPRGYQPNIQAVFISSDAHEIGFYNVPDYMAMQQDNLTHYAPMRSVVSIESWVHVYFATIICSNFARSGRLDRAIESSVFKQISLLWRAVIEQKQILGSSATVEIGQECDIDPTAIIRGPARIGNRVSIGAGVIIDNCTIGDNVTIDSGCTLFQSTVADNCFLPFRSALYLTAVMENVIVAQNTCLQMCVIGRNSFVGAGNTFTDFNLIEQKPLRAANRHGKLESVGQIVLGSAVGHNCRIGSGMIVMPGRMIESDVVLIASSHRRTIERSIQYEESDHFGFGEARARHYPRLDETHKDLAAW